MPVTARSAVVVGITIVLAAACCAAALSGRHTSPMRLVIADRSGPVHEARIGQVLRFIAVSVRNEPVPKWIRVCVDRANGPYCSNQRDPAVLIRRVRSTLVVDGHVTASVVEFGKTLVRRSIPVTG